MSNAETIGSDSEAAFSRARSSVKRCSAAVQLSTRPAPSVQVEGVRAAAPHLELWYNMPIAQVLAASSEFRNGHSNCGSALHPIATSGPDRTLQTYSGPGQLGSWDGDSKCASTMSPVMGLHDTVSGEHRAA